MYSATFIFSQNKVDDDFQHLDQEIALIAKSIDGYLGEETWENATTGLVSNIYYWQSLEALQKMVQHPRHLHAKAEQHNWLNGYQVVISEVIRTYGDAKLGTLMSSLQASNNEKNFL